MYKSFAAVYLAFLCALPVLMLLQYPDKLF
jgi:hypothetical protein